MALSHVIAILGIVSLGLPEAAADSKPAFVEFGRYKLIKGADDEMCLEIGKQIGKYQPIDLPKSWRLDPSTTMHIDYRTDLPLQGVGTKLRVPEWQALDLYHTPQTGSCTKNC